MTNYDTNQKKGKEDMRWSCERSLYRMAEKCLEDKNSCYIDIDEEDDCAEYFKEATGPDKDLKPYAKDLLVNQAQKILQLKSIRWSCESSLYRMAEKCLEEKGPCYIDIDEEDDCAEYFKEATGPDKDLEPYAKDLLVNQAQKILQSKGIQDDKFAQEFTNFQQIRALNHFCNDVSDYRGGLSPKECLKITTNNIYQAMAGCLRENDPGICTEKLLGNVEQHDEF